MSDSDSDGAQSEASDEDDDTTSEEDEPPAPLYRPVFVSRTQKEAKPAEDASADNADAPEVEARRRQARELVAHSIKRDLAESTSSSVFFGLEAAR